MILISFDNNETLVVPSYWVARDIIGFKRFTGIKAVKVVATDYYNQRAISNYADKLNNNANKPKEV
tara:strand:+ start:102 stop:299 length:198 start_codon:yes stop_codon:yes gene_type:complete